MPRARKPENVDKPRTIVIKFDSIEEEKRVLGRLREKSGNTQLTDTKTILQAIRTLAG